MAGGTLCHGRLPYAASAEIRRISHSSSSHDLWPVWAPVAGRPLCDSGMTSSPGAQGDQHRPMARRRVLAEATESPNFASRFGTTARRRPPRQRRASHQRGAASLMAHGQGKFLWTRHARRALEGLQNGPEQGSP